MTEHHVDEALTEARRKAIFQALVEAQDQRMSVPQSRKFIAKQFGVSEHDIREIEQEGLDGQWPPL